MSSSMMLRLQIYDIKADKQTDNPTMCFISIDITRNKEVKILMGLNHTWMSTEYICHYFKDRKSVNRCRVFSCKMIVSNFCVHVPHTYLPGHLKPLWRIALIHEHEVQYTTILIDWQQIRKKSIGRNDKALTTHKEVQHIENEGITTSTLQSQVFSCQGNLHWNKSCIYTLILISRWIMENKKYTFRL